MRQTRNVPAYPMVVVSATLVAFFLTSLVHIEPAYAAAVGATALALPMLVRRTVSWQDLVRAVDVPFLAFVLADGLLVQGSSIHGLGSFVAHMLPAGTSYWSLLLIASLAAILANLVSNLPAVLLLLAPATAIGPGAVLAVPIGVNAGPNLTYVGSLATLLWRRVLRKRASTSQPSNSFVWAQSLYHRYSSRLLWHCGWRYG